MLEVDEGTSILDAALDNDINLPHDCKLGVCLTCPSVVVSGEVDQSDGTLEDSVTAQVGFGRRKAAVRSVWCFWTAAVGDAARPVLPRRCGRLLLPIFSLKFVIAKRFIIRKRL